MTDVVEPVAGSNGSASQDELFSLVQQLKAGVEEMKKGQMDEEQVRAIAMQASAAARRPRPEGHVPDDVQAAAFDALGADGVQKGRVGRLQGPDRWAAMLAMPPQLVARSTQAHVDVIRHFQSSSDTLLLLSLITKQKPEELDYFHDEYLPAVRQAAMDTKTAGEGLELVRPAELSGTLIERVEGELEVLSLFPTITMPTSPFRFASRGPRQHIALLAEAVEAGTPKAKQLIPGAPTEITMTAVKYAGEIITSKELEEDAAIAILPFLQDELVEWLRFDLEDGCINGDAVAPHMDSDIQALAADHYLKGWNGLRASVPATAKVDAGNAPLTIAMLAAARAKMGRYGLKPSNLVVLVSVPDLYSLITDPLVQTVDKYGQNATLLSGELGRIYGMPFIASDQLRTNLNATGVYDGTTVDRTIALIVYKPGFMRGIRRNTTVQILTELYAESDQDAVLVTTRQAFTDKYPTQPDVAQIHNINAP